MHDLRALLRLAADHEADPSAVVIESQPLQDTPEGGYDGAELCKGSKARPAIDTLRHLPALRVADASEQDRAQAARPARNVQEATGDSVNPA